MKIVTVVGARPQFIKAAALSRELRKYFTEVLVHTGQHYDNNMSDIFFQELDIPEPDYNLHVGSGSHGKQTADILVGIEEVLIAQKPDYLLVYGDTNTTLAAALAASKLLIPIIHVEAGLRSFNKQMPEEQNRLLTDHLSQYLFCPTDTAMNNLKREGITLNVFQVGDVMCDAVYFYQDKIAGMPQEYFHKRLKPVFAKRDELSDWYLATVHRAENTRTIDAMEEILHAFEALDYPVVFPVHPRVRGFITQLQKQYKYKNIYFVEPLGYLDMLFFAKNAKKIVTDSGGLQKEAYILGKNVVTLRDQTEWIETLAGGHNKLCARNKTKILEAVYCTDIESKFQKNLYGNGETAKKIVQYLQNSVS